MSEESEFSENLDKNEIPEDQMTITSKGFTFATPSFVSSPEKVISFGINSDHVFSKRANPEINKFTFAAPTSLSQINDEQNMVIEDYDKPYKPKISGRVYEPPANLFASALRQTEGRDKLMRDYNQLKKSSKSRNTVKEDIRNSITCINVPKQLLTKTMAKEYFSQFGQILKTTVRPRKATITIYYTSKDSANAAFYKSGLFCGEKFDVQWTTSETLPKSPTKKKESSKDAVRNFITADDDEVNAELEAMMGLEYNLHASSKAKVPISEPKQRVKKIKEIPKYEKPTPKIVKTERIETEHQTQVIVPNASSEELLSIIRQAAHTSEDKYKILEARDRFLRLKQIKPNTLAAAKVTIGICPDMCPEKERLMRESQRQVALYELVEGKEYKINHAKAIKQYSRSSADQEEPLAHELRPVASLKMTMSYLLHEIMDMCMMEGTNLAEWFHFLWDRTRGIRKDITQQELCCVDSVELVEQCARFHILCSERLCAEEPSVFDKKINTENLTKCLQTLKYMYHDLRVKGVACKNEAEFRGYIILLNLNDGNFMWDLQKLPTDIQKSPEVRFAIEVHSSIESHNFCKFFKLVNRTTYLNACILLRYFNQVRVQALSVMVKAYCRKTSTPFPLYELIDILGFEDENEAVYFCEQVGLVISNDEMHIMLNLQNFSVPISSVEQGRAVNAVESKRTKSGLSVGQYIAGGNMPEKTYKNHVPHDSFDSNGHLRKSAINVEDQTKLYKSKLAPSKNDPYEFMEEDSFKSPQKIKHQSKIEDQTDSGAKKTGHTFSAEPMIKTASFGDGFNKSSKTAPLFPAVFNQNPFQKEQSLFLKQTSNVFGKSTADQNLPFGNKASQFDTKPSTRQADRDKADSRIPVQNENPGIISKPDKSMGDKTIGGDKGAASQQETAISKFKNTLPFATTTNKTIFSGFTQGNVFTKPSSGASIFENKSTPSVKPDAKSHLEQKERERLEAEAAKKKLEEVKRQLEAEKLKVQKLERERRLKLLEGEAREIAKELEDEITKEICMSVLKEEINRIRMYKVLSKNITESLLNQVVIQVCDELLKEEIHIQEQLNKISEKIKLKLVKKYYKSWRQNVTKKRRQRDALDDTPVWLQNRTVGECAKLLYHPQQDLVIQNMCRKRFKRNPTPSMEENLAPVEVIIYAGIKENLKSSDNEMVPNIFWKLVISWPDLENRILLWQHKKIMNTYLCPENYTEEPIIKTYRPNPHETFNICIRHFEGIINECNLVGTDALLFLADSSENLNTVKRRLSKTILSRSKLMPIPIAIVFLGNDDLVAENVELELDLEILLESGYVSEYTVVFEKDINKNQTLRLIQSSALWLTTNKSPLVPLEMDYLNQLLSTCLMQELWLRIQGHSNFNKYLASGLDDPSLIINLHNEAVTHLTDIFLDQESLQYTSFPREFKTFLNSDIDLPCSYEYFDDSWKKEEARLKLEQVMNGFLLPDWKDQWPIANISELHGAIRSYSLRALPDSNCDVTTCEIISTLFLMSSNSEGPSFIDLILEIVRRRIELLDESLRAVYNKNHVKHFRTLPWWFKSSVLLDYISQKEAHLANELTKQFSVGEPFEKRRKFEENEDSESNLDLDSFYKPNDSLAQFCKETHKQIISVHERCKKLESDMEKQKSKNKALNELLEKALMDEDVNLSDLTY